MQENAADTFMQTRNQKNEQYVNIVLLDYGSEDITILENGLALISTVSCFCCKAAKSPPLRLTVLKPIAIVCNKNVNNIRNL